MDNLETILTQLLEKQKTSALEKEDKGTIARKDFVKALSEIKNPNLNSKVNYRGVNFKYADLLELYKAVNKSLFANNLYVNFRTKLIDDKMILTTSITHVNGFIVDSTEMLIPYKGVDAKQFASNLTYNKRYGLALLIPVAGDEDVDGVLLDDVKVSSETNELSSEQIKVLAGLYNKLPKEFKDVIIDGKERKSLKDIKAKDFVKAIEFMEKKIKESEVK